MSEGDTQAERFRMVEAQIAGRGIRDERVLDAMRSVPREAFLPPDQVPHAYEDRALAIGMGQTISQPYIVALMTESLRPEPTHKVLEIGTGTGYQTAILARLVGHVYSVERIEELSDDARQRLGMLGLHNITFRVGDGSVGWPEYAPFDRVMVTAAAPAVIQPLVDQLTDGGRLVIPVGDEGTQRLTTIERHKGKIVEQSSIAVRFVKLIGESGFPG
ncbi:MAG: protein-L-isoaspartate(D-aspartate) O-methyltransferase [Phycisphaerae bacterium]|nr:protein-L-isoaspartate(D-aspartate) O-methyltransferase [Phycisphaerae bacterium]